jgi:cell division topological specificity factor
MSLLDYFRSNKKKSASVAKERLQMIIVAREPGSDTARLDKLRQDVIALVTTFLKCSEDSVNVTLETDDERSVLELNVSLPETTTL